MPTGMNGQAYPRPEIARAWIKANIIGAVLNAIVGFVLFILARGVGVQEADTGTFLTAVFSGMCIAGISAAMALYGFLLGVVLRQKLPALPMRSWVALYADSGSSWAAIRPMR